MALSFEVKSQGDTCLICLSGRIDRDAATMLDQAFAEALAVAPASVEFDFAEVDYINSTGIALIVSLLARARAQSLPMRASGLSDHYIHIFEITRLSDFIEIIASAGPTSSPVTSS